MVRDRLQTAAYGDRSASFRVSLCSLECGCRHRREMRWIGVGGSETLQEPLQALRIKWAQVHTTAEAALIHSGCCQTGTRLCAWKASPSVLCESVAVETFLCTSV